MTKRFCNLKYFYKNVIWSYFDEQKNTTWMKFNLSLFDYLETVRIQLTVVGCTAMQSLPYLFQWVRYFILVFSCITHNPCMWRLGVASKLKTLKFVSTAAMLDVQH